MRRCDGLAEPADRWLRRTPVPILVYGVYSYGLYSHGQVKLLCAFICGVYSYGLYSYDVYS